MNRQSAQEFISINVLGSQEVQEILMITRSRLKALVDEGKLKPIKQLTRENLFWLPDVNALKKLYLKDSRSNLFKKSEVLKHAQ